MWQKKHRETKLERMNPKIGAGGGFEEVNAGHRKIAQCEGEEKNEKEFVSVYWGVVELLTL